MVRLLSYKIDLSERHWNNDNITLADDTTTDAILTGDRHCFEIKTL